VDKSTSNPLLDDLSHTPYFIHWPQAGRYDKISACFALIWLPDGKSIPSYGAIMLAGISWAFQLSPIYGKPMLKMLQAIALYTLKTKPDNGLNLESFSTLGTLQSPNHSHLKDCCHA
jgi:hypothetical protein